MLKSTPLNKIEENDIPDKEASDEERVSRIIQEINGGDAEGQHKIPGGSQENEMNQMPTATRYVPDSVMQPHPSELMNDMQMRGREIPDINKPEEPVPVASSKKNVWAHITDIFKLPVIVGVIFFVLSLPIVDVYLAKYANWAFSNSGTLNMTGLAVKALGAGAIMGVYETIDKLISRFL